MNTQTRLISLICALLILFGGGLLYLRQAQESEAAAMLENLRTERAELLESLMELTGETLRNFAHDYSYWDEMLEFAAKETPDQEWARINLDVSLANLQANGAWVLRLDGTPFYGVVHELDESLRHLPLPKEPLLERLRSEPFAHFFSLTPNGVLEFRAAPLHPSADSARRGPAHGWLLVARLWNRPHLERLERILDSELSLTPHSLEDPAHDHHFDGIHLQRRLRGLRGETVHYVHMHYFPRPLAMLLRDNRSDLYLFAVIAVLILILTTFGLSRWVIRPLHRLEQSLATQSAKPLADMLGESSEFGRLAQLTAAAFEQRQQLESEIEERRRAVAALREGEERLRESASLKARLARDLHDGVIQSIYAAGLGLESVRTSLHTDPAAAERRLNAAQQSLNQTIREVREFIQGLEPEDTLTTEFPQALRSLATTLQGVNTTRIELRIDTHPPRLTAREEVHALQMVRESISNAVRHGGARQVTVALRREHDRPCLEIRDDGKGFDLAAARHRGGNGLANLASRAEEIDALLDIRSAPGQGSVISILFRPRPFPHDQHQPNQPSPR